MNTNARLWASSQNAANLKKSDVIHLRLLSFTWSQKEKPVAASTFLLSLLKPNNFHIFQSASLELYSIL